MGAATTGSLVHEGRGPRRVLHQRDFSSRSRTSCACTRPTRRCSRAATNPYDSMQGGGQLATYARNVDVARQPLMNLGMTAEQIEEVAASRQPAYLVQIRAPADGARHLAERLARAVLRRAGGPVHDRGPRPGLGARRRLRGAGGVLQAGHPGDRDAARRRAAGSRPWSARSRPASRPRPGRSRCASTSPTPASSCGPTCSWTSSFPSRSARPSSSRRRRCSTPGRAGSSSWSRARACSCPRTVRTGRRLGEQVEIVGGLMEGETVVTSGNFLLDSESRMRAAGAAAAGTALDPICGMEVEEAKARAQGLVSEHGGTSWFFCTPRPASRPSTATRRRRPPGRRA